MATAGENTWPRGSLPKPAGATARRDKEEGISGTVSEQLEMRGARSEPASLNSLEVFDPEFKPQRLKI